LVPDTAAPVTVRGADPLLVTVTVFSTPTDPCGTVPKLRLVGLTSAVGTA